MQDFSTSRLSIVEKHSLEDLTRALRQVNLLGDPSVFPYKHATITSRVIPFNDVHPISLYLLQHHLDMQKRLHELFLKEHMLDTLDLDRKYPMITFTLEGEKEVWHMCPPIVEVSETDGGKPILLDGEHRFLLAKELNKPIRVIWIDYVPKEYPPVAFPLSWDEVQILDEVPQESQKRHYRLPQPRHYFYYRNLSNIASGGIRGEGTT